MYKNSPASAPLLTNLSNSRRFAGIFFALIKVNFHGKNKKEGEPPSFLSDKMLCHQCFCTFKQFLCNDIDLWLIVSYDRQIHFDLWFSAGWTDNYLEIVF